jgi:hypothetical protein
LRLVISPNHLSVWKVNSANFACTAFSEVRSASGTKVPKIRNLSDALLYLWGVSYTSDMWKLAQEEPRMYPQRMVRQALRLRLPVTIAVVLLALLLALAVVGCSFGDGGTGASQKEKAPEGTSIFQTGAASTSSAGDRALLPSSLKWD